MNQRHEDKHTGDGCTPAPFGGKACRASSVPTGDSGVVATRETKERPSSKTYILTLTRSCTHDCEFCAVDALHGRSVEECGVLAKRQQEAGMELTPEKWRLVIGKILEQDPGAKFDLSGGDCLSLSWVYHDIIPFMVNKTRNPGQVAVTATAKSLVPWIDEVRTAGLAKPGTIHITYDGYRPYSEENLQLVPKIRGLGVDVHAECPLTTQNCTTESARSIYLKLRKSSISELLLMRFFPVGRGAEASRRAGLEPSDNVYREAIEEFMRIKEESPDGPKVKVQCGLRGFLPKTNGDVKCKMGDATWCIMPNGTVLTCPWAYGMGGMPLDQMFVAGNALQDDIAACWQKSRDCRETLRRRYPRACIVRTFVESPLIKEKPAA